MSLEELDEANAFALVAFADPDAEFPARMRTEVEREAARERLPKKMAERKRKSELDSRKS